MGQIRLHPSSHLVPCGPGDTVLEALERAGYALPNNCRAGACGDCKVKVRAGEFDQGFVLDMALSPLEREVGYGLMCMAKLISDELEIEWGTPDARPALFPAKEGQRFVLVDHVQRTPRITELVLRPTGAPLKYWPGQYVRVGDPELGLPIRSYSLASAPHPDGEIRLQITRVDGGRTSAWLHDLTPGAVITLSGPHGTFVGDPSIETPILCLAAGSGLAPILSLTEAALRRGYARPVTVIFSARRREDVYDQGLLQYWQMRHPNFRCIPTLTREKVDGMRHGRIPDILADVIPSLREHTVFIAGVEGFVDACRRAAQALGADDRRIFTEGFYEQPDR